MKKVLLVLGVFVFVMVSIAIAQEAKKEEAPAAPAASALTIEKAVIAKGVENREPVEPGETFSKDVGKVYCFVKVVGAKEPTEIKMTWIKGENEDMGTVTLAVKAAAWRTWGSKNIDPSWTGPWKVEVKDADGNLLTTVNFKIE